MMTGSTQTNFDPRPYQDECVQAMLHYTGHAAITSLAVGLGKTKSQPILHAQSSSAADGCCFWRTERSLSTTL